MRWTSKFEWTGKEAFVAQVLRPWTVDGKEVGVARGANGLTFATMHGAGHMVSALLCHALGCSVCSHWVT